VYFVFSRLPTGLQHVAAIFPLKWICQGLRSAFLPDHLLAAEPAHSWEHGKTALVLGVWFVASLVVCVRTFRWQRQGDR
jgi:ABC-2 type transport system permease protein